MKIDNLCLVNGKKINSIYRAIDMLCLNIGENIELDHNGRMEEYPEYSFHIQCPWVFLHNDDIILGSSDIYEPYSENVYEDWQYDEHGREDENSSVFDVRCKQLKNIFSTLEIERVDVNRRGDIEITFSNNWCFKTFISSSKKEEFWRFIDYYTREHFILYDI